MVYIKQEHNINFKEIINDKLKGCLETIQIENN